jgi:taurine dioxygenase
MAQDSYQHIKVNADIGPIGAEVSGVDLAALGAEALREIHSAWLTHGFLVFRDQQLTPAAQAAFAAHFGELDVYPFMQAVDEHPNVIPIIKEPDAKMNFGGGWHTDTSYLERPPKGTALYAVEVPEQGGDTLFADCAAAFADLSPAMQDFLKSQTGIYSPKLVHGASGDYAQNEAREQLGASYGGDEAFAEGEVEHPLIRTHDESGLQSIYCGLFHAHRIKGWSRAESLPIFKFLNKHLTQEQYVSRCQWQNGTLVLWDNRRLFHNALNDYHGQRRHMHRVIIQGPVPA